MTTSRRVGIENGSWRLFLEVKKVTHNIEREAISETRIAIEYHEAATIVRHRATRPGVLVQ